MTSKDAARYARYAEAVSAVIGYPSKAMVRALMGVADAELAEREQPDPLVGRLIACTDPTTGHVLAVGKVTDVDRTDGSLRLTATQYENPTSASASDVP
ncbi:hypothetical protein KVH31_13725 [Streptomyces olivaceus]|uniref:hypothetical protein n=1 Tax=Streptomyces olivaceus TaxID=47716 RepID=UPI001CCBA0EC|nr:hypothetical protein [Streptomyces olivaceus]MBZ6207559.1 hypothetical protein [Streptomyces olivaceus]